MKIIGMTTIGQSPRDDLVPYMEETFSRRVTVLQRGALDGLTGAEIAGLAPRAGQGTLVTRLRDGSEVPLSYEAVLPRMQAAVDELAARGAELLVVLCGADWSALRSDLLIVNPGQVFPAIVTALAKGRRLGVIKPSPAQVAGAERQFRERGIEAVATSASPYIGEARLEAARAAAEALRAARVDLVWMTCVGMDEPMRGVVREVTGKPVVLARSILSRVVDEFLVEPRVAGLL